MLQECFAKGTIKRQEAVLIGQVVLEADGAASTSLVPGVPLKDLPHLVGESRSWLGLQDDSRLDIVMVHIPSPSAAPPSSFPALIRTLEALVADGLTGSYGISAPEFTALDESQSEISVRKLFAAAENVSSDHHLSCLSYQ